MSNDLVTDAVAALDDLTRRLSVPGATCTASELAAIADRLRPAPPVEAPAPGIAEQVATLEAEVATLAQDVAAPTA